MKNTSATGNVGLLDEYAFNFTVITPSNSAKNPLPLQIKLSGHCFGRNLNKIILSQVKGNTSLIKTQIWQLFGVNITQPSSAKTVIFHFFLVN